MALSILNSLNSRSTNPTNLSRNGVPEINALTFSTFSLLPFSRSFRLYVFGSPDYCL